MNQNNNQIIYQYISLKLKLNIIVKLKKYILYNN